MRRLSVFLFWLSVIAALLFVAHHKAPPRWLPWKPLDLADPPGFWTTWKLGMLADDPQACRAVLATARIAFSPIPDQSTGDNCGFANAGKLGPQTISLSPAAPRLTCPMTAALHLWVRDVVQPAAGKNHGSRVTSLQHFGTYSCRNIAGSSKRSEHATANAIDVAAFKLANGHQISLRKNWEGMPADQAFLRDLRDGGCDIFSTTLSPDYNAAHHDHFHFDMGLWQTCG